VVNGSAATWFLTADSFFFTSLSFAFPLRLCGENEHALIDAGSMLWPDARMQQASAFIR
jgi:hypothetical protein